MSGVYERYEGDTTEVFAAFAGVDLEHSAQPLDLYFIYSIANKDTPLPKLLDNHSIAILFFATSTSKR